MDGCCLGLNNLPMTHKVSNSSPPPCEPQSWRSPNVPSHHIFGRFEGSTLPIRAYMPIWVRIFAIYRTNDQYIILISIIICCNNFVCFKFFRKCLFLGVNFLREFYTFSCICFCYWCCCRNPSWISFEYTIPIMYVIYLCSRIIITCPRKLTNITSWPIIRNWMRCIVFALSEW